MTINATIRKEDVQYVIDDLVELADECRDNALSLGESIDSIAGLIGELIDTIKAQEGVK